MSKYMSSCVPISVNTCALSNHYKQSIYSAVSRALIRGNFPSLFTLQDSTSTGLLILFYQE